MDDLTAAEPQLSLQQQVAALQAQLEKSRAAAQRTAYDLGERVKELTCLYQTSSLLQRPAPPSEVMPEVARCLVPAYQYPAVTVARIRLDGQAFTSQGFRESPWRQAATLKRDGTDVGAVEVFYLEERPPSAEGPFLAEERQLIDAVAEMVGRYLHRRHIEQAIVTGEEKYRTLIENLYEGIWQVNADYITTYVNGRTAELMECAPDDMLGHSVFDFMAPEHRATGYEVLARGRAGHRSIHELPFRRKDGTQLWTRIATTPLFDAAGAYQGALAGIVDISERKRAEALLAESEERMRRQASELEAIYWWIPIGLAVFDTHMHFLHVNRRLAEIDGVPADAHIGRPLSEISPGIASQAERISRLVLASGAPALNVEFEARTPAEPGKGQCWNTQWLPLKDASGRIWGINVVVEEITERKQWEEALYQREQEFEALAECSPDIIARVDRELRFLYINRAAQGLTGLDPEWFIGKSLEALPLSSHNKMLRKRAVEAVFQSRLQQTLEHTFDTEQGTRYFYARLVPEFDREGRVSSVLVVDRDVTELKRVQHALEQLTLHDPLTGIANRRYLEQFIAREWRRGIRHRYEMALVMVDIDHFKPYNDHFGHPGGDECLRMVAQTLESHLHRSTDLLVRYGGEEFLIVLPETGLEVARRMAEVMRDAIAATGLPNPKSPALPVVTASFGVAAAPAISCEFATLLARADHALYRAKQTGRNRVECDPAGPLPEQPGV